ncbi:MAG: YggS family pyridoxal phosphate-dependent enzyme [Pseudomonadota bacterium]
MDPQLLKDHITKLQEKVRRSSQKRHFGNTDIQLLAVSKTQPAAAIRAAYTAGLRDFGENYLQEALEKMSALEELDIFWHFIGPIQSNKTRAIAEAFTWVHSVDRVKIARRLSEQRPPTLPPLQLCLQVNTSGETSKSGVSREALLDLVEEVNPLPGLTLRGLMTVPAPEQDPERQRIPFRRLREALESCREIAPQMDTLSMGMSADLDAAILEGATIVRIGSAIFGPRGR